MIFKKLGATLTFMGYIRRLIPLSLHPDLFRRNNSDLNAYERKFYSQNGEDGIINEIFSRIGTTNRFFVEFGVQDARECNTRYLLEKKEWTGLWLDGKGDNKKIKKAFITTENINKVFDKHNVPAVFDLLSIDIDGNDLWVWKALGRDYQPRMVVVEYNAVWSARKSQVIKYSPDFRWDGSPNFGASLSALYKLAKLKGYELICCNKMGVNAFFIRSDICAGNKLITPLNPSIAYYPVGLDRKLAEAIRGDSDIQPKLWEKY